MDLFRVVIFGETSQTYFAGDDHVFLVLHHIVFVLRAFVRLANRVDGFEGAYFLWRYDGQQLDKKVRRVVILRAADTEPSQKQNVD